MHLYVFSTRVDWTAATPLNTSNLMRNDVEKWFPSNIRLGTIVLLNLCAEKLGPRVRHFASPCVSREGCMKSVSMTH